MTDAYVTEHPLDGTAEVAAAVACAADEPTIPLVGRNDGALDRHARKMDVLQRFTADANFPVLSSIISDEMDLSEADRSRMKVARLDLNKEGERGMHDNQIELISVVEAMDADLRFQWNAGDRVRSVRIAIRAAKLLGHNNIPQCYPSVFVLAATVLDTFGDNVAKRVLESAAQDNFVVAKLIARGEEPDVGLIPPAAVEMCNNWFLKIMSIRELLPRIYVELSLLKCYKYVLRKFRIPSLESVVARLAMQIRGVADPLVAMHARWYLFMRAVEVLRPELGDKWAGPLLQCCEDGLGIISRLPSIATAADIALYTPAMQWMFDVIARHTEDAPLAAFMERALALMEASPSMHFTCFLTTYISAFPCAALLAQLPRLSALLERMRDAGGKLHAATALCHLLADHPAPLPFAKSMRLAIINDLWTTIGEAAADNYADYLRGCQALLRLCARHMSSSQTNTLLTTIRATVVATPEQHEELVYAVLCTLVRCLAPAILLGLSTNFVALLQFVAVPQRRSIAVEVLRTAPTAAPQFATTLLELCRMLHDTMPDAPTAAALRGTADMLSRGVRCCFSPDVEAHLRFLCECRHALSQLDDVKFALVMQALALARNAIATRTKRSAAKGCLAFCHVTAPGINDVYLRMRACLVTASVAMQHGFVAQGEAVLQLCSAAMGEIRPLTVEDGAVRVNDHATIQTVIHFMALSAAAPPHAKYGHLYGLVAAVEWCAGYPWPSVSHGGALVSAAAIRLVSALSQGTHKVHFAGCPAPSGYCDDEAFQRTCRDVTLQAITVLSNTAGAAAACAIEAVECCVPLYPRDGRCGRLLQRSLRELIDDKNFTAENTSEAVLARRERCLAWAEATMGPELWATAMQDELQRDEPAAADEEDDRKSASSADDL
jgi:hypothetical protein